MTTSFSRPPVPPERWPGARLAWAVWGVAMALALSAYGLAFLARPYPTPAGSLPVLSLLLLYLPSVIAFPTAGALIAARQPGNAIGWLLLAGGVLDALAALAEGYWRYALVVQPGALPFGPLLLWVNVRPYALAIMLDMLLILLFPTGRVLAPRWWLAGWAIIGGGLLQFTANALLPGPLDASLTIENPIGLTGAAELLRALAAFGAVLQVGGALAAAASLLVRLRRARGVERQQLKLVVATLALYLLAIAAVAALTPAPGTALSPLSSLGFVVMAGAGALVAWAMATAILRYRLFDIDIIINRTLVYGSLTGALLLIYFGSVALLQALFRGLTGQSSTLAIVGSTLVIAALFQPLRRRIQVFIDRRFYRQPYDPTLVLAHHAATVRDEVDSTRLTAALVQAADETMRPAHIDLWLREPESRE